MVRHYGRGGYISKPDRCFMNVSDEGNEVKISAVEMA